MKRFFAASIALLVISTPGFCQEEIDKVLNQIGEITKDLPKNSSYAHRVDRYTKAKALVDEIIEKHTKNQRVYSDKELATIYTTRGYCYSELYDYGKALEDYFMALKYQPNKAGAWLGIGKIKASAPDDKLRNGKDAVTASTNAFGEFSKVLKANNTKVFLSKFEKLESDIVILGFVEDAVNAMACAHAENDDFKQAVSLLAKSENDKSKELLELFRNAKKYRFPSKEEEDRKVQANLVELKKMEEMKEKKLDERRKKWVEREALYKKNSEILIKLEKEYREAGKKSTTATDDDEQNKWKEIAKKKYNEWKALKKELELEKKEIDFEMKALSR